MSSATARQALKRLRRSLPSRAIRSSGSRFRSNAALAIEEEFDVDPSPAPRFEYQVDLSVPSTSRSALDRQKERIPFRQADIVHSTERQAYFTTGEEAGEASGTWDVTEDDQEALTELVPGRVVEGRRSGSSVIGYILANVVADGKQRLIVLRQSGEIWPISSNDVQFVMPSTLIPSSFASKCWSPELLEAWARGQEDAGSEDADGEMMSARREVVRILRKVERETEKMQARLSVSGQGTGKGGAEAVWEHVTARLKSDQRGSMTAVAAAEFMLSLQAKPGGKPSTRVKEKTLPAFAAHQMLMERPDLFVADQGEMWKSGTFLVRSKEERARIQKVQRWVEGTSSADRAIFHAFREKVRSALHAQTHGQASSAMAIEWSESDRILLHTLSMTLCETRSTQSSPFQRLSVLILRALDVYPGEAAEVSLLIRVLSELGWIPAHDTLQTSNAVEAVERHRVSSGPSIPQAQSGANNPFKGDELDTIRQDFSAHRVWVIDDASAMELDDGISVSPVAGTDAIWVHVHVADPTRLLPLDHPLSIQASFQGSSIYLPEGNTPLIPLREVMQSMSLGAVDPAGDKAGQSVVTFSALLGSQGEIKESTVQLGWIRQPRLTTYRDVSVALGVKGTEPIRPFGPIRPETEKDASTSDREPITSEEMSDLDLLRTVTQRRSGLRMRNGSFRWNFDVGTVHLLDPDRPAHNMFDTAQLPHQTRTSQTPPLIDFTVPNSAAFASDVAQVTANDAVAECMLLAGRVASDFCRDNGIKIAYRGVGAPRQIVLPGRPSDRMSFEQLLATRSPDGTIDPYTVLRAQIAVPPSKLSSEPSDHAVLGFTGTEQGYLRTTSPLRRFDDLLVHWQIKNHLASRKGIQWGKKLDETQVLSLARRAEKGSLRAKRAGINSQAFWQAGLFGSKLTSPYTSEDESKGLVDMRGVFKARSTGLTQTVRGNVRTPVFIPTLGAHAVLRDASTRWKVGDEIRVRVQETMQWPAPGMVVVEA